MGKQLWICVNCKHVWLQSRSSVCGNRHESRRQCGQTLSDAQVRRYYGVEAKNG